jgi:hypothetical protein
MARLTAPYEETMAGIWVPPWLPRDAARDSQAGSAVP